MIFYCVVTAISVHLILTTESLLRMMESQTQMLIRLDKFPSSKGRSCEKSML